MKLEYFSLDITNLDKTSDDTDRRKRSYYEDSTV